MVTPTDGVEHVIWGIESRYAFANEGDGDDWLVRRFDPTYILDNLDQAIPNAYAFSKVERRTRVTGSLGRSRKTGWQC